MEKICCRCRRKERDGRWISMKSKGDEVFSYGFCPSCYRQAMAEIKRATALRRGQAAEMQL